MTTETNPIDVNARKAAALAALGTYREGKRRERETLAAVQEAAEARALEDVRRKRAEEEERVKRSAARAEFMAARATRLADQEEANTKAKLDAEPNAHLRTAPHPARRVALKVREKTSDDAEFAALVADIQSVNFDKLKIELARVLDDERAEVLHRQQQETATRLAAEASTLPAPESDAEAEILARHGFPVPLGHRRQAELNAGAL